MMSSRTSQWISSEQQPILFHSWYLAIGTGLTVRRSHHAHTLQLDGQLFLAPLETDDIRVCLLPIHDIRPRTPSLLIRVVSDVFDRKYLTLEPEPVLDPRHICTPLFKLTVVMNVIDRYLGNVCIPIFYCPCIAY